MEKVSADTITQLTITHAHSSPAPAGPPPTTEKMITDIRARLTQRIKHLARSMQNSPADKVSAFSISHGKSVEALQKFEEIVKNVPNGFRLVPVWYSRVESRENARAAEQYKMYVRPQFLCYIAENHAAELAALGISDKGIELMKTGNNPVDASGKMCAVNIDHIIERAGGGNATLTEEIDPKMPHGSAPTYLVNHFSNFILLPIDTHEVKNMLNTVQGKDKLLPGQGDWVLMMVPEAAPGYSGYVSRPQGPLKNLYSKQSSSPVSSQPAQQQIDPLQMTFSAAAEAHNILNTVQTAEVMRPALDRVAEKLTTAFNKASKPKDMDSLRIFYEGKKFKRMSQRVKALPPEKTGKMVEALQLINAGIKERYYTADTKKAANGRRNPRP